MKYCSTFADAMKSCDERDSHQSFYPVSHLFMDVNSYLCNVN
jgi:hypothetical protein